MPEQCKLEKLTIFCKSRKRWSVSCSTDWLLANQIVGKPVRNNVCHVIMLANGPYLSFHLKMKFWEHNAENLK